MSSDDRTPLTERYAGASRVSEGDEGTRVALAADLDRPPVSARARVLDPLALREALSALHAVVSSDFRYTPKDRAAYLAFQRMRKGAAGLSAWAAQREYFAWLSRNDPTAWFVLDPVVTVQPDAVVFEVFSKDEGSYAQLTVDHAALDFEAEPVFGTTNVDFGDALLDGVQRMRRHRAARLVVGLDAVGVLSEGQPEALEKRTALPDSWLRGFTQVQSAATLPADTVTLAPIDLYNLLRWLRLHADQKKGGRAIRFELIPGEAPRLVLEPWEEVFETRLGVYGGRRGRAMRVWGRRRLMLLRRFLPFVERVDVRLLGSGLPNFWVLRAGPLTLTLGMTGFNAADWGRSLGFDVLLPRADDAGEAALGWLAEHHVGSLEAIAAGVGLQKKATRAALQAACQAGRAMYDVGRDVFRHRPLLAEPPDPARLRFRNPRERAAHDLLAAKGAVKIVKANRVHGVGTELTGKVVVAADQREYRPQMLLGEEGRARSAECTCPFHRKHQLKEGPCAHLVALRLKHALDAAKKTGPAPVETRTYTQRHAGGETIYQLHLDHRRLKMRWGLRSDARLRVQQLEFASEQAARADYQRRVEALVERGFLDAAG